MRMLKLFATLSLTFKRST